MSPRILHARILARLARRPLVRLQIMSSWFLLVIVSAIVIAMLKRIKAAQPELPENS